MSTCRATIAEAMRAFRALQPGDDPTVDELNVGMEALQNLILDLHNARGPLLDVDVIADYVAGEDQRVRIQAGYTVNVTLPNSVPIFNTPDPYDYGFAADVTQPPIGSTGMADGVQYRQPRDGVRVEVVGTTQSLFLYRADTNAWYAASGLTLDVETPLNARYTSALSALTAERMMEQWPELFEPTPGLSARTARGRSALMLQSGRARDPVQADYF
ncbi:MAG: hypothetical protein ABI306_04280 [Caulobacteraceae bacterium]